VRPNAGDFAEREVMEYPAERALLRLDVGRPDHLGPLLGFRGDELAEVGRREREHVATQVGKPRLDLGIGEARVDLPVELVDEFGPDVFGCAKSQPGARLVSRHKITDGRNFRKRIRTLCSRHRQGAEFAGPDVFDRRGHGGEHDVHLPREEVGECGRRAAVRHVVHVDAGHHLEQLARNVGATADAGRGHIDFAGIGFGVGDEVGNCLGRNRWVQHQDVGVANDASDRRDIADKIVIELVVERRVDRVRRADQEQRIAVGGRTHDRLGADIGAGARAVLDDELLTEPLRQPLAHQARGDVE